MKSIFCAVIGLVASAGISVAPAQTIEDIARQEADLVAAWEKTPLSIRRALFVTERPPIFGAYTERSSNVYPKGEKLLTYIEPVGYSWTPEAGAFRFGVTLDFVVKRPDGQVLGGQEKFLNFSQTSRSKVRELMVNIDLNVAGAPPGDYIVEYKLHDIGNGKTATVEQRFKIAE